MDVVEHRNPPQNIRFAAGALLVAWFHPAKAGPDFLRLGQVHLRAIGRQQAMAAPGLLRIIRLVELLQDRLLIELAKSAGTELGPRPRPGTGRGAAPRLGEPLGKKLIQMQLDGLRTLLEDQQQRSGKVHVAVPGKIAGTVTVGSAPGFIGQQTAHMHHHPTGNFLYSAFIGSSPMGFLIKITPLNRHLKGKDSLPGR